MHRPNELSGIIVDAAIKVHSHLGPGLLESVYHQVLRHELTRRSLSVKSEVVVPIEYEGLKFDEGFKADLIVEDTVLIEVKSVKELHDVHKKQTLTYLRLTGLSLGLLINFNESLLKHGIIRIVNNFTE
ncbi:MAG: GxxExxY protein [Planctomycetaceae bacterium]|nr:GxxExxY protein [Planctomycetaceae bacterium]